MTDDPRRLALPRAEDPRQVLTPGGQAGAGWLLAALSFGAGTVVAVIALVALGEPVVAAVLIALALAGLAGGFTALRWGVRRLRRGQAAAYLLLGAPAAVLVVPILLRYGS